VGNPACIEILEARIAPAAMVTYTDVDGDLVKITARHGPLDLTDLTLAGGDSGQLMKLNLTDMIFAGGRIESIAIRGAIVSGYETGAGAIAFTASIRSVADIGSISVGKGILGTQAAPVVISAGGQAVKPTTGEDLTIGKITIKGDVRFAKILAGFNTALGSFNADASIGPVSVSGDWVASSLVAGAQDGGTAGFGVGDIVQPVGNTALVSRIASITIRGDVTGSASTGDQFGFVAQQIDRLSVGGRTAFLTTGKSNDGFFFDHTDDVALLEV
jgi:hypothetical protein